MSQWLRALPIGLILFAGMFLAALFRKARLRQAARNFPALAEKFGINYKPSRYATGIGSLSGNIDGLAVVVDPDDQRSIIVRYDNEPAIDLRTYEQARGAPPGLYAHRFGSRSLDTFFKTRYVGQGVAERLDVGAIEAATELLRSVYARSLKHLTISPNGVTCAFDFGNPPHIPVQAVEELLPQLVQLAKTLESATTLPPELNSAP